MYLSVSILGARGQRRRKGGKERKKKGKKHQHSHEINISHIQNNCCDSIPGWGSEYSSEGVRQVQVGMWLQLIVMPLNCMLVIVPVFQNIRSEGWRWVGGWSEVQRFRGSEVSLEKSEKHIRDICQR